MAQYLVRRIDSQAIECVVRTADPADLEGPVDPTPFTAPGCELIAWSAPVDMNPPSPTAVLRWDGAAPVWEDTATLDALRLRKAEEVSIGCGMFILGGFTSDALGAPHLYPAKPNDQLNLTASVTASFMPGNTDAWRTLFWCADEDDVWTLALHTAAQIQQVGIAGKLVIEAAIVKNEALRLQIMEATAEELADITWTRP